MASRIERIPITLNGKRLKAAVEINQEVETIYSILPEPDPDWYFTDSNGHLHEYTDHGYPTLVWVVDHKCEYGESGYYECAWCKEVVVPGTRTPLPRTIALTRETTFQVEIPKHLGGIAKSEVEIEWQGKTWEAMKVAEHSWSDRAEVLVTYAVMGGPKGGPGE